MNFYEKPLSEFTESEWEQICMKCGKCCMCKYSDGDVIHFSNCMCKFFDIKKGVCSCYDTRLEMNRLECRKVSMELLEHDLDLLPPTCAYRRLYEGQGLPSYHPLITGVRVPARYTVKSMSVFSERDRDDATTKIIIRGLTEGWSNEKIEKKLEEVPKRFKLKWLETYPIAKKPTA